ncbi:hypothetical protein SELMODRAFT_442346 [Selaginella moellendorffii]|uniref:Uncharacterized protein n=1 Tax=Selaginella moellendorffii TaxID=88036 RepID=D8RSP7_SELML|nr:hypothetical protein SELMODRAFT_442346 [Selaginella moellendorffii]
MEQDSSSSSSSCPRNGRKRDRAEEEEEELEELEVQSGNPPCSSSSSKRFCDRAAGECDDDGQDLSSILEEAEHSLREAQQGLVSNVMKSLEEEIACSSDSASASSVDSRDDSTASQLGYLLEASDDELGLEPKFEQQQPAVVEEEDLVRGWSSDWSAACTADFSDEGFIDLGASQQQQEWLRRALEIFMSSSSVVPSSSSAPSVLGQGFEPAIAGLIL